LPMSMMNAGCSQYPQYLPANLQPMYYMPFPSYSPMQFSAMMPSATAFPHMPAMYPVDCPRPIHPPVSPNALAGVPPPAPTNTLQAVNGPPPLLPYHLAQNSLKLAHSGSPTNLSLRGSDFNPDSAEHLKHEVAKKLSALQTSLILKSEGTSLATNLSSTESVSDDRSVPQSSPQTVGKYRGDRHNRAIICCDSCNTRRMPARNPAKVKWFRDATMSESVNLKSPCDVCGLKLDGPAAPHLRLRCNATTEPDTTPTTPQGRRKIYKCGRCTQSFHRNDRLLAHSRIHTGISPFECGLCRSSFTRKYRLDSHMATFHADMVVAPST